MTVERERFVERFAEALEQGDAAVFVGAGLSRPAGFVDWRGLLRELADDLGLDIDRETDLIAVAQYHVNVAGGRARLDQAIMDEFTKDAAPSEAHRILARLPVRTLWTTNYDKLIENAFNATGKRLDVKTVSRSIAVTMPRRDGVLYKMHGDVQDPGDAVLTKEDYETYHMTRQAFSTALEADLLTKTFLFLGFSFTDPNLDYVLARIRGLLGDHQRTHYCLLRPPNHEPDDPNARAEWEYERRKFELRVADLQRYSIQTVLVDEYEEIPEILVDLDRRVRTRSVFISGSAIEYGEFGRVRLEAFVRLLGARLVNRGLRIVSGLGLGVGGSVVLGAMEHLYRPGVEEFGATEDLLAIRPFPIGINDAGERTRVWKMHRGNMLSEVGVVVFVSGNRLEGDEIIEAPGVHEEFSIAVGNDVTPIPVGATGFAARSLWKRVCDDQPAYFGDLDVSEQLEALGNPEATVEELVDAVLTIIGKLE